MCKDSAGRSESSEPTSHTQESGSPTTSHLRLGQRPALIHSETVPDVHVAGEIFAGSVVIIDT